MKRIAAVTIAVLALIGVFAASGVVAGCGSSGSASSDAVATVGDTSITTAQFQALLTQAKTQAVSQGQTFPAKGSATYNHYVAMIVNYLVQTQLVAQAAGKMGVTVTDKQVTDQVASLEKAYGGEAKVLAILKKQGMTMDLLKQSMKDRLLSQRVSAKIVASAAVTDAEVQAYWDAHKAELSKAKKTATFAKAKATIKQTLLSAAQQKLWTAWLAQQTKDVGVKYGAGYDPAKLSASPSPSASASPSP